MNKQNRQQFQRDRTLPLARRPRHAAGHNFSEIARHPADEQGEQAPLPQQSGERNLIVCQGNGHFLSHADPQKIDILLADKSQFIWLDLQNPGEQDIVLLRDEFHFHPLALEDATRHFERPKIDTYDHYYFLVFYAIHFDQKQGELVANALPMFIGDNFLVTIHEGPMPVIEQTIARWKKQEQMFGNNVAAIVYALLDAIVDDYFPVIDMLADQVDDLEEKMFARFNQRIQQQIFQLKRNLLAMRRVIAPERDVLNVLVRREAPIFQANTQIYLQDLYDHLMRVTDSIDTYRDILSSALDVFLSLQSNQLNQILKVLTIASIVLMSAALVAGIYGMNFEYMPELHWRYGYFFALGLMTAISGGLLLLFRKLRWI